MESVIDGFKSVKKVCEYLSENKLSISEISKKVNISEKEILDIFNRKTFTMVSQSYNFPLKLSNTKCVSADTPVSKKQKKQILPTPKPECNGYVFNRDKSRARPYTIIDNLIHAYDRIVELAETSTIEGLSKFLGTSVSSVQKIKNEGIPEYIVANLWDKYGINPYYITQGKLPKYVNKVEDPTFRELRPIVFKDSTISKRYSIDTCGTVISNHFKSKIDSHVRYNELVVFIDDNHGTKSIKNNCYLVSDLMLQTFYPELKSLKSTKVYFLDGNNKNCHLDNLLFITYHGKWGTSNEEVKNIINDLITNYGYRNLLTLNQINLEKLKSDKIDFNDFKSNYVLQKLFNIANKNITINQNERIEPMNENNNKNIEQSSTSTEKITNARNVLLSFLLSEELFKKDPFRKDIKQIYNGVTDDNPQLKTIEMLVKIHFSQEALKEIYLRNFERYLSNTEELTPCVEPNQEIENLLNSDKLKEVTDISNPQFEDNYTREALVIEYAKKHNTFKSGEIDKLLGKSRFITKGILKSMIERGLLVRIGKTVAARYELVKK